MSHVGIREHSPTAGGDGTLRTGNRSWSVRSCRGSEGKSDGSRGQGGEGLGRP